MDSLDSLPVDKTRPLSRDEQEILQTYFAQSPSSRKTSEFKIILCASIVYLILSTSYFDTLVEMLPHTGSPLIKYIIKALIFFTVVYIVTIMLG